MKKALLIAALVLIADQWLKVWVKTHLYYGAQIDVFGQWFLLHFVENNGFAFGMEFGGETGKLVLSLFRIVAVSFIGYYLFRYVSSGPTVVVVGGALVFSGALGNIIDCTFYGVIFNSSYHQIAEFLPEEGGYSSLLHGRVVDMLNFPLFTGHYPSWVPVLGGQEFIFFRPVFNIADAAISIGIVLLLLNYKALSHHLQIALHGNAESATIE